MVLNKTWLYTSFMASHVFPLHLKGVKVLLQTVYS